jgi:hypothetical protein
MTGPSHMLNSPPRSIDDRLTRENRNFGTTNLHKLPKHNLLRKVFTTPEQGTAEAGEDQDAPSPADRFTAQGRHTCQSLPTWPPWPPCSPVP